MIFVNFAFMNTEVKELCKYCGEQHTVNTYGCINVSLNPELKLQVLNGSLFLWECPHCGGKNLICSPLIYIDAKEQLIIILSKENLSIETPQDGDFAGFKTRQVHSAGALIELVKIFDAGLDDEVIDLCKQVTKMEMSQNSLELIFVKTEGADNEIIFTYPKDGQMEMIATGFNVYEDCKAILDAHRR